MLRTIFASLAARLHDPDGTIFHRALRVAIVLPLLFALGLHGLSDPQFALLAAFGSFAALAMADFMGPRSSRLAAFAGLGLIGAMLIVLGTALSHTLWPAVIAMLALGAALQFAMALGGQFALGNNAALLAFVVAVMVPAGNEAIVSRVGGWIAAMIASALAATLLWPRHERRDLYARLAEACRPLAALARAVADGAAPGTLLEETHAAIDKVHSVQTALGFRPIGPPGHQQALLGLIDALGQAWRFSGLMVRNSTLNAADRDLARAVSATLDAIADALQECASGHILSVPDIESLTVARRAHHRLLDAAASAALASRTPGPLLAAEFAAAFPIRVLSFVTLSMATDAIVMTGRSVRLDDDFFVAEPTAAESAVRRAANVLAPHLSPRSVWLHNSLRAGLALGLAVLVGKLADIGHAFWVVLATLAILRSNVATTGSTVISAIAGTFAGFVLATLTLMALGTNAALHWAALPFSVFLATYAPGAISFASGQAMFALMVVELFNLMVPAGWEVGVVRLEAVTVGALVALAASLIMWPKGASAALRAEVAMQVRAGQRVVEAAFDSLIDRADAATVDAAREAVLSARHRVEEALAAYIGERGAKRVPLDVWGLVVRVPIVMRVASDAATAMRRAGYTAIETGEAARRFREATMSIGAAFGTFADRLEDPHCPLDPTVRATIADLDMVDGKGAQRAAIMSAAADYVEAHRDDPATISKVMALSWAIGWLSYLAFIYGVAEPALDDVLGHADTPWWR